MTYLAKNIDDEEVDFSPKSVKEMVRKLYRIPAHTDEDAGTLMDACDIMYAQMEEIKRLRGCTPALADLPLRSIRSDKPDVRTRIRHIAVAALKRFRRPHMKG